MDKNYNLPLDEIFNLAIENHKKNNLKEAQNFYTQVLQVDPNYINANINLGVIFQDTGDYEKAKKYYDNAIKIDPNNVSANGNLGVIFKALGENQKAKSCYEKAIEFAPNYVNAHSNLGVVFEELGDLEKAKSCFEKAIEINPNIANIQSNLGAIFHKLGEYQKAKSCFQKAIEINPNYIDANQRLGILFKVLGDFPKAKSYFKKIIEIDPNNLVAYNHLGSLQHQLGEFQKAISFFKKIIEIDPNSLAAYINISQSYAAETNSEKAISSSYKALKIYHDKSTFVNQSVPLFRLKHDVQQAKYLSSKNYKIDGLVEFQKVGDEILNRKENKEDKNNYDKKILLTPDEVGALLPYHKSDHVYKPKKISGSCINPDKNWQDVEDEYFNSSNQIMFIDNFLSEEALIELREFCLVSKVWNKEYHNKHLGAFSANGFISPIHLQIAKDLQLKLPKLFGPHNFSQFWGFKYDATLGKGINIHADFAIHNLNFWITPDEYNNNKNSGGLKVYDAPAPDDWPFANYNGGFKNDKIYKFLKDNNAKCTNVPYKFNRAVLFNSAYFHETDEIDFKDEYEGRRINNTYLFGQRLVKELK